MHHRRLVRKGPHARSSSALKEAVVASSLAAKAAAKALEMSNKVDSAELRSASHEAHRAAKISLGTALGLYEKGR